MKVLTGRGIYQDSKGSKSEGNFCIPLDSITHTMEADHMTTVLFLTNGGSMIVSFDNMLKVKTETVGSMSALINNQIDELAKMRP
jgi:hypothetical protein